MAATTEIPAAMRERAYTIYAGHPSVPLKDIAAFLGVSVTTFRRLRRDWNWSPREDAASDGECPAAGDRPGRTGGSGLHQAAAALAQAARSRIEALMAEQSATRSIDHEKTARALASYARTLTAAQALLEQEGTKGHDAGHDGPASRSLSELHDELARHLERIVAEEQAGGGDGRLV